MKSFAFFNACHGAGTTFLAFHVAHMLARLGKRTVVVDFDPQGVLTDLFLTYAQRRDIASDRKSRRHVAGCLYPVRMALANVESPELSPVEENLWLLPADLDLELFELFLSDAQRYAARGAEDAAFGVSAFGSLVAAAANSVHADFLILAAAPRLSALTLRTLRLCDALVVTVSPDVLDIQGLSLISAALERLSAPSLDRAAGDRSVPIGYVVMSDSLSIAFQADAPAARQASRHIPTRYRNDVLGSTRSGRESAANVEDSILTDANCLGAMPVLASLIPLAEAARKPMFDLKQVDGLGSIQAKAVLQSAREYEELTRRIMSRLDQLPARTTPR